MNANVGFKSGNQTHQNNGHVPPNNNGFRNEY